jgi:hypothetical protein
MEEVWCSLEEFKKVSPEYFHVSLRTLRRKAVSGELGPTMKLLGKGCTKVYLLQLTEQRKIQMLYRLRTVRCRIAERKNGGNNKRSIRITNHRNIIPQDFYFLLTERQYRLLFWEFIRQADEKVILRNKQNKRRIHTPIDVYQKLSLIARANNCSIPAAFWELHSRFAGSKRGKFARIIAMDLLRPEKKAHLDLKNKNDDSEGGEDEKILLPEN